MKPIAMAILAAWCLAGLLSAGESSSTNPLADLPSKPGPHIEKIRALGDNAWLNLGCPEGDPRWGAEGVARGRAWCSKMAAAPDLGGAFFCGTGVHGAVKSDGRYMDDLWFYDALAHRWICLYPGASKETKLKLDKHGFEVTEDGEDIPISYLSHAYNNTTYNTDLKLYHIMWTQCPWWGKAVPQRWEWLDVPKEKQTYGNVGGVIPLTKHPLLWDVAANKWERTFVEGAGPGGRFEGVAEYIPSLKQTLYTYQGATWFYDYASNTWKAGAKVPASVAVYDSNGCFDSKRERVYVAKANGFACYDVKLGTWTEIKAEGQPEHLGATNNAQLYFDAANGVVLWHQSNGPIAVYDPDANRWTDLGDSTPDISGKGESLKHFLWHGFYHAALNAHFFYRAGDSNLNKATMLVYRYKNVKP
ncbi:MAG: hypothetical protein HS116_02665 [Planctomycetes bacterium]|nr:hypothetical protein [Planctomycetota bacterium]